MSESLELPRPGPQHAGLQAIIFEGVFPPRSERPTRFARWWEKHVQQFEHIDRPNVLHTPPDYIPQTDQRFQILQNAKSTNTSWHILFPDIDIKGHDTSIPIVRVRDAEGIIRGYPTIEFKKKSELGKTLSSEDVERVRLYYDVSTIIMGGSDGYRVAEALTQHCINHNDQKIQQIDNIFSKRSYPEIKILFKEHPDQILTYLIHTIVETHMIDPKNISPAELTRLAQLRNILREVNPSSVATNNTNLETNINDAMVYLQELWISRAYPHLFALGNEAVARKTDLPHEQRFNTMKTTRMIDRALHHTGIIDQDDTTFNLRGNFKSGSSLLLAVLSEQEDVRDQIFTTLTRFGIQTDKIRVLKSPMDQAIALLAPLEQMIVQELTHSTPDRTLIAQKLIKEFQKRMNNKEYFVRCYATSVDTEHLLDAIVAGERKVAQFRKQKSSSTTIPEKSISVRAFATMKRENASWAQQFSPDDIRALYKDLPNHERYAPFWFLLDHIYQLPQDGTGFAMWYVHLPAQIEIVHGNKQLHILTPKELEQRVHQRKTDSICWMEIELGSDLSVLLANLTRPSWEKRSYTLHPDSLPANTSQTLDRLKEQAKERDHRIGEYRIRRLPIPKEFY